jgi:hypothetical protein
MCFVRDPGGGGAGREIGGLLGEAAEARIPDLDLAVWKYLVCRVVGIVTI